MSYKWKRLKQIRRFTPCSDCKVQATRENFGRGGCRWHWARIEGGKTLKICTSCSSKRGLPVPWLADLFSEVKA